MDKIAEELAKMLESENCDYDNCRKIINEVGGCTAIVEGRYCLTTPLNIAIDYEQYDFAIELMHTPGIDLNAIPIEENILWELQYLDKTVENERWEESRHKLKLLRELIKCGADPNPKPDAETLLQFIRYKLSNGESDDYPEAIHLWCMEHIIEKYTFGDTDRIFQKIKSDSVKCIMLSDWGFKLIDDNQCWSDHAILVFDDDSMAAVSSYQADDDEYFLYAVPVNYDIELSTDRYRVIYPIHGLIKFYSEHLGMNDVRELLFSVDDAILSIGSEDNELTIGILSSNEQSSVMKKRISLFKKIGE